VPGSDAWHSLQWLAPDKKDSDQGCLLIVHGMSEHVGRYGNIARYFADRFIVAGIDLTAHGMSNTVLAKANESLAKGLKRSTSVTPFWNKPSLAICSLCGTT
jgi:alpha-beta hydrolase superfamily lysophospholipase